MSERYFGIELGFRLAYLLPEMENPEPACPKTVRFPISRKLSVHCAQHALGEGLSTEAALKLAERTAAAEHIANAFAKKAMPCSPLEELGYINCWTVDIDTSVLDKSENPVLDRRFGWYKMEVASAALQLRSEFSDLKRKINTVCAILRESYRTQIDDSCTLNVHVSYGKKFDKEDEQTIWTFKTLKKLMMFFWAFEPQIDALHPPHMVRPNTHAKTMRGDSSLGERYHLETSGSQRLKGLRDLNSIHDLDDLYKMISCEGVEKDMRVSIHSILGHDHAVEEELLAGHDMRKRIDKHTVEFRQHAGTLDGREIQAWLMTLDNIHWWLEWHGDIELEILNLIPGYPEVSSDFPALVADRAEHCLTLQTKARTAIRSDEWEGFTIIDLFKAMGLSKAAECWEARVLEFYAKTRT